MPSAAEPCHARIVPRSVIRHIRRPMKIAGGTVTPDQLIRWNGDYDLNERFGESLRSQVARTSAVVGQVLSTCTDVRLTGDWGKFLENAQRKAVEAFMRSQHGRGLENMTISEVRSGMGLSLEELLALLAKIEAATWQSDPSLAPAVEKADVAHPRKLTELSPHDRTVVQAALRLTWLNEIDLNDVRFGHLSEIGMRAWLENWLEASAADERLVPTAEALVKADTLSFAEEVAAIATAALNRVLDRKAREQMGRSVAIYVGRFVSEEGRGRSLQKAADPWDVTRERVRQVTGKITDTMNRTRQAVPATQRVLAEASALAPVGVVDLNGRLANLLGKGAGIESAIRFAEEVGLPEIPVTVSHHDIKLQGERTTVGVVERVTSDPWIRQAVKFGISAYGGDDEEPLEDRLSTTLGKLQRLQALPAPKDERNCFLLRVNTHRLRTGEYVVPMSFMMSMIGRTYKLVGKGGTVSVNEEGVLMALRAYFPRLKVGDWLRVEVGLNSLKILPVTERRGHISGASSGPA